MRLNENNITQKTAEMIVLFLEHEGWSTGELRLITGYETNDLKRWMRYFEREGLGEFTINDGMYRFWFSPDGRVFAEGLST